MKSLIYTTLALGFLTTVHGALKTGDSLTPYEITNSRTGDTYCQICAYGEKQGKVVAFGKLDDADFWADLTRLQTLAEKYPKLGIFAQVLDSKDLKAIKAAAEKNGVKFPVVIAVEGDWDDAYAVKGVSRTIYYAEKNNKITWTSVGLESPATEALQKKLSVDLAG